MEIRKSLEYLNQFRTRFPEKFVSEDKAYSHIRRGGRVFIATGCGEPQYLVNSLVEFVKSHPKAFFDAEVIQVWTLGMAPYADEKLKANFRHNSFFIGENTRDSVNKGMADYTPVFLSAIPKLLQRKMVEIDVALIQVSPPDHNGMMSLGISVDIVKSAVENASVTIAQVNSKMPRVHGDTFINIEEIDFIFHHDEELLEYRLEEEDEESNTIGEYVNRIVQDGDTIQVGYGGLPNFVLSHFKDKKNLGIHTELLSDGIVELIKSGIINNSQKSIDRGKTVAAFCMGSKSTYEYLNDNPSFSFHPIDYTNNPLTIANLDRIVTINTALQVDLTGQATSESLGSLFHSGIGGQADFMRGANLSKIGKSILVIKSTYDNGKSSSIVPSIEIGAGVTLNRGDVQYIITEYGIAYIYGKSIRERALDLVSIAHPDFRKWLMDEACSKGLINKELITQNGHNFNYPDNLEKFRFTRGGLKIHLRPVKLEDEEIVREFFNTVSDDKIIDDIIKQHFNPEESISTGDGTDLNTDQILILALSEEDHHSIVVGAGKYNLDKQSLSAGIDLFVIKDFQNMGIGTEILSYLTYLAKKDGLLYFSAEVHVENEPVFRLLENYGFRIKKSIGDGIYEMRIYFKR